jgi:hypothetical protein
MFFDEYTMSDTLKKIIKDGHNDSEDTKAAR